MFARIDRILNKLAEPHRLSMKAIKPDDNPYDVLDQNALTLAKEANILVLVGHLPVELTNMRDVYVDDWINGYAQLYRLLAGALFPDHRTLRAWDADRRNPPIATLEGDASPLFPVFYTAIVPYLQERQPHRQLLKDHEISGFLDYLLLEELFADDLPAAQYKGLLDVGVELLRQMLNAPINHIRIKTIPPPKKQIAPPPPGVPGMDRLNVVEPQPASPSPLLIEDDQPATPTEQMFIDIPLWHSDSKRVPPVPPLPDRPDERDNDQDKRNRQ